MTAELKVCRDEAAQEELSDQSLLRRSVRKHSHHTESSSQTSEVLLRLYDRSSF